MQGSWVQTLPFSLWPPKLAFTPASTVPLGIRSKTFMGCLKPQRAPNPKNTFSYTKGQVTYTAIMRCTKG